MGLPAEFAQQLSPYIAIMIDRNIRKAVIPVAGYGTRFLPASKAQPKEMFLVVDKPTIQYVVEEAVAAGIKDILMIISKGKRAIEEHFDPNRELEAKLEHAGRTLELEEIRRISSMANIHYIWQRELNGLGDAVSYAKHHVGDEAFALLLGDTIVESNTPVTRQLIDIHQRYGESVVAFEQVTLDKVSRYGIMKGRAIEDRLYQVEDLVEKPAPGSAPSNLAIAGRYLLTPDIFPSLENIPPGKNNEIQLTDALRMLLQQKPIYGLHFEGNRYDIGNKLDFLKTNVIFGLRHAELGAEFRQFLERLSDTGPDD